MDIIFCFDLYCYKLCGYDVFFSFFASLRKYLTLCVHWWKLYSTIYTSISMSMFFVSVVRVFGVIFTAIVYACWCVFEPIFNKHNIMYKMNEKKNPWNEFDTEKKNEIYFFFDWVLSDNNKINQNYAIFIQFKCALKRFLNMWP